MTIQTSDDSPPLKVAKSVLCGASKFFVKALDGGFRESQDLRLTLPGCSYETAKLLVYWVYHEELPDFYSECEETGDKEYTRRCILGLAQVWMLGDQILMPKLQNAAAGEIIAILAIAHTGAPLIRDVCSIAPRSSKLRQIFLVEANYDYYNGRVTEPDLEELKDVPDCLIDLLQIAHADKYCDQFGYKSARQIEMSEFEVDADIAESA